MKKFISLVLSLVIFSGAAFAADKAQLKIGPSKVKVKTASEKGSLVAQSQGDFINIAIGGSSKKGSGSLTILLPDDATLEAGSTIGVFSLTGEESADNPGEAAVSFTSVKAKGTKVTTLTEAAETVTTGQITVKAYDATTKELKFNIKATASPITQNKVSVKNPTGGNETVNKKVLIKGQVVVTLP